MTTKDSLPKQMWIEMWRAAGYTVGLMTSFVLMDFIFFNGQMIEIITGVAGRTLACVLELPI